jgi:hypothetical protein
MNGVKGAKMDTRTGELLRDFGMASVVSNTEEKWRSEYKREAELWLNTVGVGTVIVGEQMRDALEPLIGTPHHVNAWSAMAGCVIRKWKKERRVLNHGATTAKSAAAHARLVRQYLKVQ